MVNKKSKLGIGLLLGAIGGALAGLFLAPQSGKATQKDAKKLYEKLKKNLTKEKLEKKVKAIFGKVTKETQATYLKARGMLIDTAAEFGERLNSVDKKKYQKIVDDLVSNVEKTSKYSAKTLKKLNKELVKDWQSITKSS
jgi:gas vesicle protein